MGFKRYKEILLKYLNKEDLESHGAVDPMEFHTVFSSFAKLFCVMDFKHKPYWMYISPYGTLCSATIACIFFTISVAHYISITNIHLITECGTYLLIMLYKFILSVTVMKKKKEYHDFLRAIRKDFHYICTRGHKYREKFFDSQRMTFKVCVLMAVFTGTMGGGMAATACFSVAWTITSSPPGTPRPLPYPLWFFDHDLSATPAYEIVFMLSLMFTFFEAYFYIFVMQSHILWIRTIASKADIVVWNLQDMLVDVEPVTNQEELDHQDRVIQHRMREIIIMHHDMISLTEAYASVFRHCLLYEQLITSPTVCMTAFCFVEKLESGEFKIILLFMCVAIIGVVIIPSYLCTHLLEKCKSVGEAVRDVPFWLVKGSVLRPYLVLLVQRSNRKLPTVAAGFADISLETYAKMMTRAYSCFNMLRQADFNI